MKIELYTPMPSLIDGKIETGLITNLIGITSNITVFSTLNGTMFFQNTERVEAFNVETATKISIEDLLDQKDIEIMVGDICIFNSKNGWGEKMVRRCGKELEPIQ